MKYFSVDFLPDKTDVNKKAVLFNILFGADKSKLFPTLLIICAFTAFAFFVQQYELIFYTVLALIVVPKISQAILVFSQTNKAETELSKRPVTVDFYGDHIVYRYNSTERFRGNFEKHFAFSNVTNVIESNNALTFAFGESDTVLIPKRALTAETAQLISNLTENLFKNKYIKVDF